MKTLNVWESQDETLPASLQIVSDFALETFDLNCKDIIVVKKNSMEQEVVCIGFLMGPANAVKNALSDKLKHLIAFDKMKARFPSHRVLIGKYHVPWTGKIDRPYSNYRCILVHEKVES